MEDVKLFVVVGLFSALVCYCIGSFIAWDWNPGIWDITGRVLLFGLWVVMFLAGVSFEKVKREIRKP